MKLASSSNCYAINPNKKNVLETTLTSILNSSFEDNYQGIFSILFSNSGCQHNNQLVPNSIFVVPVFIQIKDSY